MESLDIVNEPFLSQSGIKGQKWGVRNGPPYPLDEKQKSSVEKKESDSSSDSVSTKSSTKKIKSKKEIDSSSDGVSAKSLIKKMKSKKVKLSSLSDQEVQAKINRLRLEKEYKQLYNEVNPQRSSKEVVKKYAGLFLSKMATKVIEKGTDKLVDKMFNKEDSQEKEIKELETSNKLLKLLKEKESLTKTEDSRDKEIKELELNNKLTKLRNEKKTLSNQNDEETSRQFKYTYSILDNDDTTGYVQTIYEKIYADKQDDK